MKDFRINLDETDREREIRVCQSPAFESLLTNEDALTMLEHAIEYLRQSREYWDNVEYLPTERAMTTLLEAWHAIGTTGQIPSWEMEWQCNGCARAEVLTGRTCPNCGRTREESRMLG